MNILYKSLTPKTICHSTDLNKFYSKEIPQPEKKYIVTVHEGLLHQLHHRFEKFVN